jgi:hypothetical protein
MGHRVDVPDVLPISAISSGYMCNRDDNKRKLKEIDEILKIVKILTK